MEKERPIHRLPDIIRGPEDLPEGIDYPTLSRLVGGKAAGLLLIQRHCPEIPTPPMIVYPAEMSQIDIYNDVLRSGMTPPLIIRASSAFDDELGYEDAFPTELWTDLYSPNLVWRLIENVATVSKNEAVNVSPTNRSIIISPFATSSNPCVLISHPHSQKVLIAKTEHFPSFQAQFEREFVHREYIVYEKTNNSIRLLDACTNVEREYLYFRDLVSSLALSYYQKITSQIPGLDKDFVYQMEFGDNPIQIFQIRKFMKKEVLKKEIKGNLRDVVMVFGVTPPEGILVQVCDVHLLPKEKAKNKISYRDKTHLQAILCDLRDLSKKDLQGQVNFVVGLRGIFQHDDIRKIRKTPLTIALDSSLLMLSDRGNTIIEDGDFIRVFSDGTNVRVERV